MLLVFLSAECGWCFLVSKPHLYMLFGCHLLVRWSWNSVVNFWTPYQFTTFTIPSLVSSLRHVSLPLQISSNERTLRCKVPLIMVMTPAALSSLLQGDPYIEHGWKNFAALAMLSLNSLEDQWVSWTLITLSLSLSMYSYWWYWLWIEMITS